MKVGGLVKVSNNGFTAIGYIKEITDRGYYVVHYFSQHGNGADLRSTGGLWSHPYITAIKEVISEKEISKT